MVKIKLKHTLEVSKNNFLCVRSDPNTKQILDSMRSGAINIKQAAEALGMEPAMLAYQLAGRVRINFMDFFNVQFCCVR